MCSDAGCLPVCLVSTDMDSETTWLLFLPYFQLKAETPVEGVTWLLILTLTGSSLEMVGRLFLFHVYLCQCPSMPQPTLVSVCPLTFTCDLRQAVPPPTRNELHAQGQTNTPRGSRVHSAPRNAETRTRCQTGRRHAGSRGQGQEALPIERHGQKHP